MEHLVANHDDFISPVTINHGTCDDMSRKPPLTTEPPIHTVFHLILSIAGCGKGWTSCRKICNIVSRSSNGVLESYLDMYPVECRDLWDIRRRYLMVHWGEALLHDHRGPVSTTLAISPLL